MADQAGVASYHQLEEFLDQSGQRAFWIFSFSLALGLFAGLFAGRALAALLPPAWGGLLGAPLLVAGALLGIAATWQAQGQPLYARAWNRLSFAAQRLARPGGARVSSADIYDQPAPPAAPVEWAERGRPAFTFAAAPGAAAAADRPDPRSRA